MASIVVVGAGIAGLSCAWRLQHAGHDVEVLEAEDVPGGRLRTDEVDGYRLERGARFLGAFDSNGRVMVRALGLGGALVPLEPAAEGVLRRGRVELLDTSSLREFARSPLLSARAKLRAARLGLELVRQHSAFDLHHPEFAAGLEHTDAATDLAQVAGVELRDFALRPLLEAWTGAPLAATSDAFARLLLSSLLGAQAPQGLTGGMGRISQALSAEVPVRCGAVVQSVETEQGGACVRYRVGSRERRAYADAAVVAVAGPRVIDLCPKLTPEERGFFETTVCLPQIVVHALLDEPPRHVGCQRLHLPEPLGFTIASIGLEHARRDAVPPGAGLLRIELASAAVAKAWSEDDDRLAKGLLEEVERTPLGAVRARRTVVQRTDHGAVQFAPGSLARLRRFVERPSRTPRLAFAGGHVVGPYTEGSLTSGLRAASEVVRGLDSPARSL